MCSSTERLRTCGGFFVVPAEAVFHAEADSLSSSSEFVKDAVVDEMVETEGVDVASRTIRACKTVQTSQRTVRRDSCKMRGRRSSYRKSHSVSRY